ncbi:MAG: hypothetical protein RIC19_06250 [Phaeodactylibacter sp.]|uniref:hypothetical protein n=1 Tax=Phaeodactylibacter sp. TaxID=1940289 RepID=UPI0032ECDC8B
MEMDRPTLLNEAEQLRRRWFRQLQAIEGEPNWRRGWERLENLRSLIKQASQHTGEDWAEQPAAQQLRHLLQEAKDL